MLFGVFEFCQIDLREEIRLDKRMRQEKLRQLQYEIENDLLLKYEISQLMEKNFSGNVIAHEFIQ